MISARLTYGGAHFLLQVGAFPEPDAQKLFAQVVLSMSYLHEQNIVHGGHFHIGR